MRPLAKKALRITRGDVERAADWAFNNWDSPIDDEDDSPDTGKTVQFYVSPSPKLVY